MKAYLLSVGDEVLSGKVINTNASYLASELEKLGISTSKGIVVGDDVATIQSVVCEFLASDATLLISTGGLGPTHDDCTKEAICEALGLKLVFNERASQDLFHYFGTVKEDCNAKQAYFPANSHIISNPIGSADGVIIEHCDKTVILLVGPSLEMQTLFQRDVIPYLQGKSTPPLLQDYWVMGESESYFENILVPLLKDFPEVQCNPYAGLGVIRYRLMAEPIHEASYLEAKNLFEVKLAPYIISQNQETIEELIVKLLDERHETVSCAESMTGGLIAQKLTSVPGASRVLHESYVVYSNDAKTKILGVSPQTLETYTAVSCEVAQEMVKGLYQVTKTPLTLAITGWAGPDGPAVGTGWIAIRYHEQMVLEAFHVHGNREMIRTKACNRLLYYAYVMMRKGVL